MLDGVLQVAGFFAYFADGHLGPGGLEVHLVLHAVLYAAALVAATLIWSLVVYPRGLYKRVSVARSAIEKDAVSVVDDGREVERLRVDDIADLLPRRQLFALCLIGTSHYECPHFQGHSRPFYLLLHWNSNQITFSLFALLLFILPGLESRRK